MHSNRYPSPLVGLIPAAGRASRLGTLPCSKEILPVGRRDGGEGPLRVACEGILEAMQEGGAERAYVVLRSGKWDIPAFLGNGAAHGLPLGYLMMRRPYGVPFTIDDAFPFLSDATVLFGFPDIVVETDEPVFPPLLRHLEASGADVVLGLMPSERPEKSDAVDVSADGRVRRISVKPDVTALTHAWIVAVWRPVFSTFLHDYVAALDEPSRMEERPELHLGHVFQAAIDAGGHVQGVKVPGGRYIDLGTPDELSTFVTGQWERRTTRAFPRPRRSGNE